MCDLRWRQREWRTRLWRVEDRRVARGETGVPVWLDGRDARPPPSRAGDFGEWGRDFERGEPDFKCRSAFRAVVAGDLSLVVLNHTIRRAESEDGAFAHRLGGVERVEDALGIAQAGARVGELDDHFICFAPEGDLETSAAGFL